MTPVLSVTPTGRSRIAMLSVHTCPLAALGGKETGGMNVYVRELARSLGRLGFEIDVFTRSQDPAIPEVVRLGAGARVIHVSAGPARPIARGYRRYDFLRGEESYKYGFGAAPTEVLRVTLERP